MVLTRAGKPAFRLVPVEEREEREEKPKPALDFRVPGQFRGQIWMSDDFDDEMTGFEDEDEDGDLGSP